MKLVISVAGAAVALAASQAYAAPIEIKFASPTPPKAHLNVQVFTPWSKEVTEASGGTLKVELVAGPILASHRNVFDRVRKNVAGIGWGLQALVPGQFDRSSIVEVPGLFETSVNSSIALWRLHEKGMLGDEYADVKPLAIFSFPSSSVHSKSEIRTLDDLKGRKVAVAGKIRGEVAAALGAVPISLAPPEYYQSTSRGLVDGFLIPWTGIAPYRLHEVSKFSIDGPLGGAAGMIIMNKQAYAKLPAKAKQAIDSHSGETLVVRFSKFWDRIQSGARKKFGGGKHTTTVPAGDERARMIKALSVVEEAWAKRTPDGPKLLAAFKAEIEKAQSAK